MDAARLKTAAVIVTAVWTIVSGLDKIKNILQGWKKEHKEKAEFNKLK